MKKLFIFFTLLMLVLVFSFCNNDKEKMTQSIPQPELEMAKAFKLAESNCFSCHSPDPMRQPKIAPDMAEIKLAYLNKHKSFSSFADSFSSFLLQPSEDKSVMPDAVAQYGLMPKMPFSEDEYKNLAKFLWNEKIEKSDWYSKSFNDIVQKSKQLLNNQELSAVEKGKELALSTKAVLGKNLLEAIKEKGTSGALSFCNSRAYTLTDSMAHLLDAKIKRVSDKNRNPDNAANESELAYIDQCKTKLAQGSKLTPLVDESGEYIKAYYPIMTTDMCLQCHGSPGKDITEETLLMIDSLYPDDMAKGYKANELRGIWVIEWKT